MRFSSWRRTYLRVRAPPRSSANRYGAREFWCCTSAPLLVAAVLILVGGNAALEGVAWPLIGGLYLLLMYGLWMFTRILTLRN